MHMRRRKLWSINCLLIVIILSSIIPIRVFAKKDGYSNAKPRLVVDSFKVSEDAIVPGEDFELELVLSKIGRAHV